MTDQITQFPWPPGQPWASHHSSLTRYLRAFSSWLGTNANDKNADFEYNTRVETVSKRFSNDGEHVGWKLLLRKLVQVDDDVWEETWWTEVRRSAFSHIGFNPAFYFRTLTPSSSPLVVSTFRTFQQSQVSLSGRSVSRTESSMVVSIAVQRLLPAGAFWSSVPEPVGQRYREISTPLRQKASSLSG